MAAPGLELLFSLESRGFSKPQDPLICFIHWELVSSGLHCFGRGEKAGEQDTGSERLPDGWGDNKELYTLRYGTDASRFLLKALTVEGTLIVNIMDLRSEKVCDLTLDVAVYVDSAHLQQYDRVYKSPSHLRRLLHSDLIAPLLGTKEERKASSEQEQGPPNRDPLRVPPRVTGGWRTPPGDLPYGAADLDPLGGRSGGMIMDPFHAGRSRPRIDPTMGFPPGSVPPGARFDPLGPLGARQPGPDPDHLPPPGYDDMFM
ncbi:proteasome inhibitor PI31 subunit [Spea bombifrons]|uniref:proteasome inhibitor PI31 subunit n=1 Tax=Spea bombifrons TaxID=233779 RepID=UPI00234A7BB2|nr:proteasome inhibitor PI31 subunit [Spea bombifrons]